MLTEGFNSAMEALKDLDVETVVADAMKIAEGRGLDSDGRVRLRGEGSSEEETN